MKVKLLLLVALLSLSAFTPPKIVWVAIGDSITYLNDHPNETGNRITKGYMTRVVERLPQLEYVNKGYNGWTSGGIAEKIESLGLTKADVYTVFLGTNDWWQGRPLGNFSDYENNTGNATVHGSFRIIINKLRDLNKDAKIVLITPMQRVDFVYIANMKNNAHGSYKEKKGQWLAQFAAAINAIGKFEHLEVLDLYHTPQLKIEKLVKFKRLKDPQTGFYKNYKYPTFIDVPFDPVTDEYPYPLEAVDMTYDGLHPSDKGYEVIARKLVRVLK
ncbi:MAG TPA: SGNH/GDSL hydrolase family protein [Haliscomenobacter sp.]|uniref:SGNH/GDSL hydrolase family protein n=1 Tax=Haliscomenobacter sp. TaxID=2717303 RepID=UPI002C03F5C9|nr:SGNH/GDSL hydrolase family protein [Haliscomenobacter sp.]HOY18008.1 SGNH/GDSL hydrolase family protein [Haliscomenobacter sp.]HPH21020.1 SGNH/GDSL hydrolase family protein [Haliscomenobacter sp.]